jgi:CelD/BcsL family acetyltransferase involved in cellulose biosynthesis
MKVPAHPPAPLQPAAPAAGDLQVHEVDPTSDPRWDAFVRGDSRATAFHRSAWLGVLAEEYEQPHHHLLCTEGGRVVGVLPLVQTRGVPLGLSGYLGSARLSSLPRTPMAGPLADGSAATSALLAAARARAAELKVQLQIKPAVVELDGLVAEVVGVPWRYTYVLQLPEDPADLCFGTRGKHGRIRRMVLKSRRDGVVVRPGTAADVHGWYRLYLEAMRLHAQPARPERFFVALLAACERDGLGRFTVAETSNPSRIVGGVYSLDGTEVVSYAFTGLDRRAATLRPVDALLWEAIHHACAEGMRRYDFGEVPNGNLPLAEFKLKWGARPEQLRRFYWPPIAPEDAKEGGPPPWIEGVSVAAWRRLPLGLTALAGRVVHRYL